jgi:hypothetical protein
MEYEVSTTVGMKIVIISDVTQSSFVDDYENVGGKIMFSKR